MSDEPLACLKLAMLEEPLPCGEARDRQARAHREVDITWQGGEVASLHCYIFRQGAVAMPIGEAKYALAHRQARCAVTKRGDYTGQLVSWN